MRYITCAEAANFMGMTVRRIQQMCKNGKIVGAIKQGRAWMIPKEFFGESKDVILKRSQKRKPLPIGVSDFKTAVSDYYYVDKTLFIRDLIDNIKTIRLCYTTYCQTDGR